MMYDKILGIAACDPQGIMGKKGRLPWHYPLEIQHFRETIGASPLIMGHATFLTLPAHYFEGRTTIIFSRAKHQPKHPHHQYFVSSLEEFHALKGNYQTLYVIGGAQVFRLFLEANLIEACILTKLIHSFDGDTLFPLPLLNGWKEQILKTTADFAIFRYTNPLEIPHAHKNS